MPMNALLVTLLVFSVMAAMLALSVAAEDGNVTAACEGNCSTAVGTVNVTVVDVPPPGFTGLFAYEPLDFSGLLSAISAFFSGIFGG